MKVKMKLRKKKYWPADCGCCDHIYLKHANRDKQELKEALEEINGEDVLPGSNT